MPDSMAELLRKDMECEGLLECFHGLRELDRECFQVLATTDEPLTIDEIATRVGRERSTAYRAVQRLLTAGFVQKEQVNYEQGGYHHVYKIANADDVADDLQRLLNDWYAKMGTLIQEFRTKYDHEEVEAQG
ncbi:MULTISPECIES: helix-turn-helix domain-containing protein [unclassified Haladaptatus]|uniref:helix-turn-helix domain-containing protein n=1 Tax=unclassified Haladaptatus TaxID=2622732 RepID=UPI0023E777A1|nr:MULTISPECIES: helix-turn-helix domain-containing protein [unclassified Haladaptatus]